MPPSGCRRDRLQHARISLGAIHTWRSECQSAFPDLSEQLQCDRQLVHAGDGKIPIAVDIQLRARFHVNEGDADVPFDARTIRSNVARKIREVRAGCQQANAENEGQDTAKKARAIARSFARAAPGRPNEAISPYIPGRSVARPALF